MGKRGPKPTPVSILNMRGSRRASSREEIAHVEGGIECPAWLGKEGQQKFAQLLPLMTAVPGLMKPAFADALALYCEAFEEFMAARRAIESSGAVVHSSKGSAYQNPEVGRKNKAIQRMRQFGAMFGMSPADATRVNPGDSGSGDVADPFSNLIATE